MNATFCTLICSVSAMTIAACSGSKTPSVWPGRADLVSKYEEASGAKLPTGKISLRQAVAASLSHHPELRASAFQVEAEEARALQENLYSNPEVEVELEEFAGTGDRSGFNASVSTLRLSQSFPLFGRFAKGRRAAVYDARIEGRRHEMKRLDIVTRATLSYIDVVSSEQHEAVAVLGLSLMESLRDAVAARVQAGKVSPLEYTRAEVQAILASGELMDARRKLAQARGALAFMWGQSNVDVGSSLDSLPPSFDIPPIDQVERQIENSPRLVEYEDILKSRKAHVDLEQARAVPDLSVGLGLQHFNENGDLGATTSIAVDLPIFDRNQGGVNESRALLSKAEATAQAARMEMRVRVQNAYLDLESARQTSELIDSQVMPKAEEVSKVLGEAYGRGEVGLLDFIDAQKTLLEARRDQIEALANFHRSLAKLEGLLGLPIDEIER